MGRFGCYLGKEGIFVEEITDEQVCIAFVCEVIGCSLLPWAIGDVPGEHWLCKGRGFVLGTDGASADVICYICVNAGSVYCISCLCLHLLYPLVGSMQVSKGMVKEFWGNINAATFEEEAGLYGQLVPGAPNVLGYPWDLLPVIGPNP